MSAHLSTCIPALAPLLDAPHTLHPLHAPERSWPQTNCSVDLLIELIAAYGYDPTWMLAFTVTQDFEGDHFTFFKVPSEDLEALYGLCIQELAVWDNLESHIRTQLQRGHVVLVEVDGYYLPDTRGVTYQTEHSKTTIGIFALDEAEQTLGYFHNETRGTLCGPDYLGTLQKLPEQAALLMPYCEVIKPLGLPATDPAHLATRQLAKHLLRRPQRNPFSAYAQVFPEHMAQLHTRRPAYFHAYAFNTLRQTGANFGLLESFLLALPGQPYAAGAAHARNLAQAAKALQFKLARAAVRGNFDGMLGTIHGMAHTYDLLMQELTRHGADV